MSLNDISALIGQAAAHIQEGRLEDALAVCEQAVRLQPQSAEAYGYCAFVLKQLGRLDEALIASERMTQFAQNNSGAISNHALILLELGRFEEALAACDRAIQIDPYNSGAHTNRSGALKGLGRVKEALAACDRVVQINPQNPGAHSNRGVVLKHLRRLDEALAAFDTALQLRPDFAGAHYKRGETLKDMGHLEAAAEALKTALRHDPNLTDAQSVLAAMGAGEAPPQSPLQSTKELFNNYADRFDTDLVDNLGYRIPTYLFNAVTQHTDDARKFDILDLGCGTGLGGAAFSGCIGDHLVGVDLAPRMLEKARERGLYTNLIPGDVCQAMDQCTLTFDLILAADVFVYIGKLEGVFSRVAGMLNPGGLFAFSIEVSEDGDDYHVVSTGRYAQTVAYIQRLAEINRLEQMTCSPVTVRHERGNPVAGYIFVLRR